MFRYVKSFFSASKTFSPEAGPSWTDDSWDEKQYEALVKSSGIRLPQWANMDNVSGSSCTHLSHATVNIDGSPMVGLVDINGNPYGVANVSAYEASSSFMDDGGPFVNIDGTPMCGDIDMHGNPYGVTSDDAFDNSY